jgi:pteridine reductase
MTLSSKPSNKPSENAQDRDRPVVWVTGSGARRVGRTVAIHFAAHGYDIALHARQSIAEGAEGAQEIKARGGDSLLTVGDVSDMEAMKRAVDGIQTKFGRLDALVHCAAIWDWKPLEATTVDDVRRQFEVNTLGAYVVSHCAGLQMVEQPNGGSITLIGDWAVSRPYCDFSAYFVGKGAIETLVRTMAVELATRNPSIRVNGLLPGPVMLDDSISVEAAERIRQSSLLKKQGTPEHVATAAYFLSTHEFITGVCIPVDGGRTIWAKDDTDRIAHPTFVGSRVELGG